jgi:hypothetical protein
MKNRIFAMLGLMALVGCATTQSFQKEINQYVGLSSSDLAKKMGQPIKQYQQGENNVLVYRPLTFDLPIPMPNMTINPSMGYVGGFSGGGVSMTSTTQKIRSNCQIHFSLLNDVVQSWQAVGKDCPHR